MAPKKKSRGLGKDRRRKHHHWLATIYVLDGEKLARVYIAREKAKRFAAR